MKTSKFNYIIKKPNTDSIVYNTLNNSFVSLLNEELECLTTGKFDLLPQEVVGSLYDNGFLIDETMDETEFLKYQFDRTRYATETFAVTIAPTLNCNFACEYCYESPRPGVLDDAGFGLIMDFIRSAYDRAPFKRLQVNWYGGEPMLCVQSIARWSKGLLRFSESHAVKYVSHIITNGSLVTEKNVALLEGSKISNAQVTIDGWGDMHDKRRPSRDGKPKFDLILSAVELMAKHGIEVSIRVNADINNLSDYQKLADYFQGTENVYVHIGHLRDYEALPADIFRCFDCEGFSKAEYEIFEKSGYTIEDMDNIFSKRRMFCGACTENSYVIDDRCNVYKCWNDIGDESQAIFNLHVPEESRDVNYAALCRYMTWNPFEDETCGACAWMPICGGGCVFEKRKLGDPFCYPPVYSVDKYLDLYLKEVREDEDNQES